MTFKQRIDFGDKPVEGTLIAGNVRIPFTVSHMRQDVVVGRIGENRNENTFYASDNWTFEPDVPPLPTKPGFYIDKRNIRNGFANPTANIYRLMAGGYWRDTNGRPFLEARMTAEEIHARGDLVRVEVVLSTIASTLDLDKE